MNAENSNSVIKRSLSNTNEYCKIHFKAARCYKMIMLFTFPVNIRTKDKGTNNSIYFDCVSENGWIVKYRPLKGLSCVMGNYHAQFLGGEGP
jgi:hypothetical protein